MKIFGVQLEEGTNISNLTVASGTTFPGSANEAELFFRSDTDIRVRGLYCYTGGTWDRLASADATTVPSGPAFPNQANTGDLFYLSSGDSTAGLYVYNGTTWSAASSAGSSLTVTGDVTGTLAVGGSAALTLATVNSNTGAIGSASTATIVTLNAKGLTTAASTTPIAIDTAQVTSGTFADARIAASNVTQHQAALTILETQITDGALLARNADNETIVGNWQFSSPVVVTTPTSGSHATTKDYVDQSIAGLSWKSAVTAGTTANITLSGTQTIDGVAVVAGNRVLVKSQSTQSQNGVYVVAAGAWIRATDFDQTSPIDEVNGAAVFIRGGTTQASTAWTQTATVSTIGTDSIVFAQFSGASSYLGGAGLTLSGNTFDVNTASATRIVVNADNIDLATVTNSATGTFQKLTTDSYGRVTGTTAVVAGDITPLTNASYVAKAGDTMTGTLNLTSDGLSLRPRAATSTGTPGIRIDDSTGARTLEIFSAGVAAYGAPVGSMIINTPSTVPLSFGTNDTVRMTIATNGNIGVGAASPTSKLDVNNGSTANPILTVQASALTGNKTQLGLDTTGSRSYLASSSTYPLAFDVNATERMRINSSGQVGIGTSPALLFDVIGAGTLGTSTWYDLAAFREGASGNGKGISLGYDSASQLGIVRATSGGPNSGIAFWGFTSGWGERMRIDTTGNVGIGSTTPLKKLVVSNGAAGFEWDVAVSPMRQLMYDRTAGGYVDAQFEGLSLGFYTGATTTQRMIIDSSGNVGIGGAAGGYRLNVNNGGTSGAKLFKFGGTGITSLFGYSDASGSGLTNTDPYSMLYYMTATTHSFYCGGTIYLTTSSSGTTVNRLDINGTGGSIYGYWDSAAAGSAYIGLKAAGTIYGYFGNSSGTSGVAGNVGLRSETGIVFSTGGATERMKLDSSGNLSLPTASANLTVGNNGSGFFGNALRCDVVDSAAAGDSLELCYYQGSEVRIGQGADGNKALRAGALYDSGSRVITAAAGTAVAASSVSGPAVINGSDGWFRSSGGCGWYNSTYAGGVYMVDTTWVRTYNSVGLYANYFGGPVSGSSYGGIRVDGATGGYSGIYLSYSAGTVVGMYDSAGNGGDYDSTTGWHTYWLRSSACLGIGGSSTTAGYKMHVNGAGLIAGDLRVNGSITRGTHSTGYLIGSYNSVGANANNTNPIYTIGSAYTPTDTSLSNMYGIGYTNSSSGFAVGGTGWGQYVCANGTARIFLSGETGSINAAGDVIAYASDRRLKTNITPIANSLDKVKQLRGVEYDWIDGVEKLGFIPSAKHETGVIAQEVQVIIPDAVRTAPFNAEATKLSGVDENYLTVDKEKIIPLLIEAIKELNAKVEALQAKLDSKE